MKKVLKTWLPLLGSWMLMSIELPIITSIIARLANPEINLAAYGGVVYPLALIIEAPIVMILAASTALSKDWASYQRLKKYTLIIGISMSALHLIIAVTPLYYFIVEVLLHVPPEVVEPARWGGACDDTLDVWDWSQALSTRGDDPIQSIPYGW